MQCKGKGVSASGNSIFRFFMAANGEHFLSNSIDEGCNAGYAFENISFCLFDASSAIKSGY